MKKHLTKAYLAAFILLFFAPTILFELFGPYIDSTNYEQRATAEKPVFSLQTLEEYPQQFEAYYNDHLPFRTQLIEANSKLFLQILRQSPVDKVILGKDGWLFYNPRGTDGDPIADYQGTRLFTEDQLAKIAQTLIYARDLLRRQGKEFVFLVAPNKESIYGNTYLPDQFVSGNTYTNGDQLVEYLRSHTDLTVVYPKQELLGAIQANPEHLYYYKTDTHWNELGGYIGAVELLKALNISMPEVSELQITRNSGFSGDLAKMTGLQSEFAYDHSYTLSGYTNHPARLVLNDAENLIQYTADSADDRSILVIRDSFSISMYPYLASQFRNTTFALRGEYSFDSLPNCPADIVVAQFVERYWDYLLYYFDA